LIFDLMMEKHNDKRLQIVTLHQYTDQSMGDIANHLDISKSTVSRTIKRFEETDDYKTQYENCGRKAAFDERAIRHMKSIVVKDPRLSAGQIQEKMGAGNYDVSTVRRHLRAAGCKTVKPYRRPYLNEAQVIKRYNWAKAHKDWSVNDWKAVLFSDETIVQITDNCPQYVRIVDGHPLIPPHYNKTTKHPCQVMFWACFAFNGTGRAHVVEGNMNTDAYIRVVDSRVEPQLNEWYPDKTGIFQQDNAPCHVSKAARAHFSEKGIQLLDWPPSSPDLNPIENLWAIIKNRLKKEMQPSNKKDLIRNFIHVWHRDPELQEICQKLVISMPERVNAVLASKGRQTNY
jgi:transposase